MKNNDLKNNKAINSKEEVAKNPDNRIDQDFPGFPHSPSKESTIKPKTNEDEVNANLKTKKTDQDANHVGSANAFEGTEGGEILRGELDDDHATDNKDANY